MHNTGIEREILVQPLLCSRNQYESELKVRSPSFIIPKTNVSSLHRTPGARSGSSLGTRGPVGWHGECGVESRHYVPPSNGARTRNRAYRVSSSCFTSMRHRGSETAKKSGSRVSTSGQAGAERADASRSSASSHERGYTFVE